jgi:hypothetical protein
MRIVVEICRDLSAVVCAELYWKMGNVSAEIALNTMIDLNFFFFDTEIVRFIDS